MRAGAEAVAIAVADRYRHEAAAIEAVTASDAVTAPVATTSVQTTTVQVQRPSTKSQVGFTIEVTEGVPLSFTLFLQIMANVAFTVALFVVFARLRRPAKDDPRMSKGLQLLSSKIAVLEDLSDRTETQVQQMLVLLDQKSKELQSKVHLAEQQVLAVRQSMDQSLEVARIFQDKIPHTEIIERQNSVKYIRAARLAHAGHSVTEIAREVDLPLGEIEFISKVNRENLSFREEDLPPWAREPGVEPGEMSGRGFAASTMATGHSAAAGAVAAPTSTSKGAMTVVDRLGELQFEMNNLDLELARRSARGVAPDTSNAFEPPRLDSSSLERLGEEFRRAVEQAEREAGESGSLTTAQHLDAFYGVTSAPASASVPGPTSARDATAAKNRSNTSPPADEASRSGAGPANAELEAARAAANALKSKDIAASVASAGAKVPDKTVRRVEFPRI